MARTVLVKILSNILISGLVSLFAYSFVSSVQSATCVSLATDGSGACLVWQDDPVTPGVLQGSGGVNSVGGNNPPNPNSVGGAAGCAPGKICNPLASQTITEFLLKIIDVLLVFALPLIILYIMYAGYLFVTANGNSEQVSTARNALLWAVVGGVLVLGARLIIGVIQGTVAAF